MNEPKKKIELPNNIDVSMASFEDVVDNRKLIIEIINRLNKGEK